ncbi:hypothetical protein KL918_002293 [Ogataea parapolymorpha]|uniref:Acyl carrier protein n=1 Tax=Ogataea parapolymorpha (strain ATCC 26012 / BCRC 20466 / JCM 22074 / NRRL Y-7560 / DL-1) TaxID=871575 RepID=W1QJX0_OGAPD|nr:hypothetical protein HPODL_02246 [Ogataea parapolymorpha DL-1]ESX02932.1 hypothetical protein HPODL_02246 [Ogataea parapolymorpha DL-1]KAG7867696.1 hypothetical protein KL918_002293 [Ogataea parapolymorpha]KAG7869770.1 hypothetical protein KL916_005115 [Ogataea parapolymorpha]KAG7881277.1 hypothetical protein KL938_003407 [Ogataea parapolymorpha]
MFPASRFGCRALAMAARQGVVKPTTHMLPVSGLRFYSSAPTLTREIVMERITEMLECYNKIKPGTPLTEKTSFSKDLGLDSLDSVEIMMEIEYEFSIHIADQDQDSIKTIGQAVDYIVKQRDAC